MGRPRKYATEEEAAEAKRIQNKKSEERQKVANPEKVKEQTKKKNKKQREKINSDPKKKAKVTAQKKASKDKKKYRKQLVIVLSEILQKKKEDNANFQTAFSQFKITQAKAACETASEMFEYQSNK